MGIPALYRIVTNEIKMKDDVGASGAAAAQGKHGRCRSAFQTTPTGLASLPSVTS